MKHLLTAAIMFVMATATMAQKLQPNDIVGVWEATDKTFKLEYLKTAGSTKPTCSMATSWWKRMEKHLKRTQRIPMKNCVPDQ